MNLENIYASGRDGLMPFSILTNPKYQVNWHHKVIAKELEEIERRVKTGGKPIFLLLEIPPRHGKSEEASINFPAWFLGRNPSMEIITSSYSSDLSQDFGSKTRNLVQSPEYQAIFPNMALRQDSQSKAKWITGEGGSYTSVGVGGALTGRGANILLIDDPIKNREEADSETIRNKIWGWFRSTAYSRLEPNGAVIIIMQRWHKYDLIGKIKDQFRGREDIEIKEIIFPALATQDEEFRKYGEALWASRYSVDALDSIRATIGEINWASQFQQVPILAENMEFKSEYFRYFEEEDILDLDLDVTVALDLATGDKEVKNGDDVAITVVGKEKGKPNWYVLEVIGGILDPLQVCDALFAIHERYRPKRFVIESNAYQRTFEFWLKQEMKKREVYLPVHLVNNTRNKEERIRGLIPLYKTGIIFHRKSYLKLESQLLNFPMGDHDDYPDSLALQLQAINPADSSKKELEDAMNRYLNS